MLAGYNKFKVLKVFLDSPLEEFGLRETSRKAGISPASVLNYLKGLEKESFIKKIKKKRNPVYIAQRDNENFKFYKKIAVLEELHSSGIVDELWQKTAPEAIILYGSYAKGEAVDNSDIDLFIISKNAKKTISDYKIDEKYAKIIGKEIHIIIDNIKNISDKLINNLINGIILKGYLKVL